MSDRDSASIQAQLVEILGPDVGPVVARGVIGAAIPGYGEIDGCWPARLRDRPRALRRQTLGVAVAFILSRAGVSMPKTRGGQLDQVLTVVFGAVGEPVPDDMFDFIQRTLLEVDWRRQDIGVE
jgi:hypothetical protein